METDHTHHYTPQLSGRHRGEPVQELRCDCGERPADAALRRIAARKQARG